MNTKPLDPSLAAILASIRETVASESMPEPEVELPVHDAPPSHAHPARSAVPAVPARTVEDFLADLLRPHVKAWVDANLAEIVQKLAAEEVRRLTARND
ncbi:MAG: DUF2497 domain-containing protein [Sphingomonadaceae bacterium]